MSKSKGNFRHNYPIVIKYLKDNELEYAEYNNGHHLKIMGPTRYIELWPSRMTYHIIQGETEDAKYHKQELNIDVDLDELESIL